MPRSSDLPDDLKPLVRRNALEVSHTRFKSDCARLIAALERALKEAKAEQPGAQSRVQRGQAKRTKSAMESGKGRLRWRPLTVVAILVGAGVSLFALGVYLKRPSSTPAPTVTATPAPPPARGFPNAKLVPFENSLGMRFVPVPGTYVYFSVWETRVKDYQAWCDATGRFWAKPRFSQSGEEPAVNVSWEDGQAFCEWLSEKEGKSYRLPTDDEWSRAVGIGDWKETTDVFPWGKQWPPPNDAGNYLGEECKTAAGIAELKAAAENDKMSSPVIEGFNDGEVLTAAAGSFRPSGLGIYDLGGNVWEWCQDEDTPLETSTIQTAVLRGGSWASGSRGSLQSSYRLGVVPDYRREDVGFRAVVVADPFDPRIRY
jgi:Sulfatase-modifying factor enzyme 1